MKKTVKKALRLLMTAALILSLTVVMPGGLISPVSAAVTQAEIDALKNDAKGLEAQKSELKQQLKAVAADKSKALEQKSILEQQIGVIQSQIDNISNQIVQYDVLIAEKEGQIADTQQKEARQYELFCQRVRMMEEDGEESYWAILFNSSSFSDFLDRFMMVEEIIDYDNAVMDQLIALREQIQTEKADLEVSRAEQEQAKAQQEAAKAELKEQESQVDSLVAEISAKEDQLEKAERQLKAAAAAMDAEIKKKEKELAAQLAKVVSEDGFIWPLDKSWNTLSSLYGSRIHPITGKANNHTGIDIPASGGQNIYATKSGVVTISTYNRSYGNYVVVSHSNGQSTLYAHMSKRAVSEGATVKQGQVIGYVGTTGSSTGNHLHYEVRINGDRTDPLNYYKGSTLYARSGGKTVPLNV